MDRHEVTKIIYILAIEYPRLITEDLNKRVELWLGKLQGFEYEVVEVAARDVLSTCRFEPKIADILDAIKKRHRALFPSAEEIWHKWESWLKTDYNIKEQARYKDECGSTRCMHYKTCNHRDYECPRMIETIPAHYDREKQRVEYEALPQVIRDYFYDIEHSAKMSKANEITWDKSRERFIKFYDNAVLKTELQMTMPKEKLSKIQGDQNLRLNATAKSLVDKDKARQELAEVDNYDSDNSSNEYYWQRD